LSRSRSHRVSGWTRPCRTDPKALPQAGGTSPPVQNTGHGHARRTAPRRTCPGPGVACAAEGPTTGSTQSAQGHRGACRQASGEPGRPASTTSRPTRPDAAFAKRTGSNWVHEVLRAGSGRGVPRGRRCDDRVTHIGFGVPRSGGGNPARATDRSIRHGSSPRPCRRRGRRTSCAAQFAPHPAREEVP